MRPPVVLLLFLLGFTPRIAMYGQSTGTAGTVNGSVLDPTGAAIPGATIQIQNPVSHYNQTVKTDDQGNFLFVNIPFNNYHLTTQASGFQSTVQDVDVRSPVPLQLKISLMVGAATTSVEVTAAADLLEGDPTPHTDVDRALFDKLPLESASSSLSSLVTLASPGVAADSNGLFHGLGDHASNSFSLDGQPITDQQSKVFSNQIPLDAVQSLEVIQGAPPAEYGGKTSLIIDVTTRSGQGQKAPTGDVTASYGTFGTSMGGFNLAYGGDKWGNFLSTDFLNTGRFLDAPEFTVMHDKGNEGNVFDRVDYQFSEADSIHLDMQFTRSWFQNPNTYDQEYHPGIAATGEADVNPITGAPLGPSDQRSKITTFDFSPTWTHLINPSTVFTFGAYARLDQFNYFPSTDPFADLSPDLQNMSVSQSRRLFNVGVRSDVSYIKGMHNLKVGIQYQHTFLTEGETFGIVDPAVEAPCLEANGNPVPGTPCVALRPYDLTQGGSYFIFHGHADIKEFAVYIQDTIKKGNWTFNLGMRGDVYRGLVGANQAEPRVGIAYNLKPTNTVFRISYARTLESPFNENLVISSTGCSIPFLATITPPAGVACNLGAIHPGWRNDFHAGIEQAFGKHLVIDAEYMWKYTHNAFDFGIVGATPIYYPIEWHDSKIPGWTVRASVPNYHGFTAQVVMSGVAARFYLPQVAGLPVIPIGNEVFRIDHDELFNETTHFQYQPWKRGPWFSFNWRFDTGLVSGAVPCSAPTATCSAATPIGDGGGANIPSGEVALVNAITGLPLTADQEFQAGLTCDGKPAAPNPLGPALATCNAAGLGSTLVKVPAPGTENDDHNPQRIQARHLFDVAIGHDNLFNGDKYRWSARVEVINLTNNDVLYNFLSTFSGTHYVGPRTVTGTIGFHF